MRPPRLSTMLFTDESPSPVPLSPLVVKYGSKQLRRLRHRVAQIHSHRRHAGLTSQTSKLARRRSRLLNRRLYIVERRRQVGRVAANDVGVPLDDEKGIVEVVSDAARQTTENLQLARLCERLVLLP